MKQTPGGLFPFVEIVRKPRITKRRSLSISSTSPNPSPRKKAKQWAEPVSGYVNPSQASSPTLNGHAGAPPGSPSASDYLGVSENASEVPSERLYNFADDEVVETEDLAVEGESSADDGDTVPIRFLTDFTFYELATGNIVEGTELLALLPENDGFSTRALGASGLVEPWSDEGRYTFDDEDSEPEESSSCRWDRTKLAKIVELNVHHVEGYSLDKKIYIRTQYAWYILGQPNSNYSPSFTGLWIRHRALNLLIELARQHRGLSYEDFLNYLDEGKVEDNYDEELEEAGLPIAGDILGRSLHSTDIAEESVKTYLLSMLKPIADSSFRIRTVPVVRDILKPFNELETEPSPQKSRDPRSSRPARNKEREVLKHKALTFLTPRVNRLAEKFFANTLEVASSAADHNISRISEQIEQSKIHSRDPKSISFRSPLAEKGKFTTALVDGVRYKSGDVVMVNPDSMQRNNEPPEAGTANQFGNRLWFCQIRWFFTGVGNEQMFHGVWFVHGSRTILQQVAHSHSLYLISSCDDLPVSSIYQKCNFEILHPSDVEEDDDYRKDANNFHCGLLYDEENASFCDLPLNALDPTSGEALCFACDVSTQNEELESTVFSDDSLLHLGITYHVHDYVYIFPTKETNLLDIGQILSMEGRSAHDLRIQVALFGRLDDVCEKDEPKDERCLVWLDKHVSVPVHKLDDKCYVKHLTNSKKIEVWVQEDNHFYFNQSWEASELVKYHGIQPEICSICEEEDQVQYENKQKFISQNNKLVGMELFSGAGGLGIGMNLSNFVDTKYAVEFSVAAAKTYQVNHPGTKVYCQDSNTLLKSAVEGEPKKVHSLNGKTWCPSMPSKGDRIDFIFGGPPCQSFSRMNHTKRADDVRSTLPCNMLSYVEHYEPDYFLLENVAGLLDHKFQHQATVGGKTVDQTITYGMVKLILRILIALGYQVSFQLLQAAQYGVPQGRQRVIFWGAKRGLAMPEFPIPMYAFEGRSTSLSLPTNQKKPYQTRSRDPNQIHCFAPLKPISIDDAISDLAEFEWIDPHVTFKWTSQDKAEVERRKHMGIIQVDATDKNTGVAGFVKGVGYALEPQTRYQKWLRRGMDLDDEVTGHHTLTFAKHVVEIVCNVPLKPNADNKDVIPTLLPAYARSEKNSKKSYYGRLDGTKLFKCALTQMMPGAKGSWILHPTQKRIISIRECARAQGFPDSYVFESTNDTERARAQDKIRQIGNAVAVPFALALGKKLGEALIKNWEKKKREVSVEV